MTHASLRLQIITQEKKLAEIEVTQLTVMTSTGELTILPGHIGLFTKLQEGLLRYVENNRESTVAIYGGFMDVAPSGAVTILADAADRAEDLDLKSIEEAKRKAEAVLADKHAKPEDFLVAETALRQIYLKERAARTRASGTQKNV